MLNVVDFGAKGDNSTDNTAAFKAALAAAHKEGGGEVYVGPGLYVFTGGSITVPPGVTLSGSYGSVPSHDLRSHQPLDDGSILIPLQVFSCSSLHEAQTTRNANLGTEHAWWLRYQLH